MSERGENKLYNRRNVVLGELDIERLRILDQKCVCCSEVKSKIDFYPKRANDRTSADRKPECIECMKKLPGATVRIFPKKLFRGI